MSYLFDASGEKLDGAFTSTYGHEITLAAWVKKTDWDANQGGIVVLGEIANEIDDSVFLIQSASIDKIDARIRESGGSQARAELTFTADAYDGVWVVVVARFTGNDTTNARDVYIEDSTNTDNNTANRTITGTLDQILIGNADTALTDPFEGLIAEVCIWDIALTTGEIDQLQSGSGTGPAPNTIQSSNVIGYWPLEDGGDLLNQGSDAGGDLTATGATSDPDHPTITNGNGENLMPASYSQSMVRF